MSDIIRIVLVRGQHLWVVSTLALEPGCLVSNPGFNTFKLGSFGPQFLLLKMRMMAVPPSRWLLL